MAIRKLNLDARIHRIVIIGEDISAEAGVQVVTEKDAGNNWLKITRGAIVRRIKCNSIFTPPRVGVRIRQIDSGSDQHVCDLETSNRRTFELGAELSDDVHTSVIFIHREGALGGSTGDFLLLSDSSGDETIAIDGAKIPPDTGEEELAQRRTATKKKAAPKKKKAAPKKKKSAAKKR